MAFSYLLIRFVTCLSINNIKLVSNEIAGIYVLTTCVFDIWTTMVFLSDFCGTPPLTLNLLPISFARPSRYVIDTFRVFVNVARAERRWKYVSRTDQDVVRIVYIVRARAKPKSIYTSLNFTEHDQRAIIITVVRNRRAPYTRSLFFRRPLVLRVRRTISCVHVRRVCFFRQSCAYPSRSRYIIYVYF